jgi:hypothetical protein
VADIHEAPDNVAGVDMRTKTVRRLDYLTDQMIDLTKLVREIVDNMPPHGTAQVVIHKNEGLGSWGVAGVVACFFTVLMMILSAIIFVPEIHDLRAWHDIDRKDIARLQAAQEKVK